MAAAKRKRAKKGTARKGKSVMRKGGGGAGLAARVKKLEQATKKLEHNDKVIVGILATHHQALTTGGLLSERAKRPALGRGKK